LSNLLSARDERSIERRYTGSKLLLNKIRTMKKLLVVLVVALVGCGGSEATTPKRAPAAVSPSCTTSGLVVWLGVGEGGAAAGSTYYPLEFTNTSASPGSRPWPVTSWARRPGGIAHIPPTR
jgi:hypothetical protein